MFTLGALMNHAVMLANDDKMPVAMRAHDLLFAFSLSSGHDGIYHHLTDEFLATQVMDDRHRPLHDETRLRFLADRIAINVTPSITKRFPKWTHPLLHLTWFPPEHIGRLVSIGDLTQWSGMTGLLGTILWKFCFMFFARLRKSAKRD